MKMKKNLKSLERRIAKLGQVFHRRNPNILCYDPVEQTVRDGLAPNERIVKDFYQDADGRAVITLERVTANPSDMGKDVPHGSWDRDKLYARFRHSQIERIVWELPHREIPAIEKLELEKQTEPQEPLDSTLAGKGDGDSEPRWLGDPCVGQSPPRT
jgi:hypothetical protein